MALKPDRLINPFGDDLSFFMDEVADVGGIASLSTGGSGAAMDQSAALVTYATNPSGKIPVGVLLTKMVNKDLTQNHLNKYNGEVQKGGKVRVNRQCVVTTDMIYPALTPAAGDTAYVVTSGLLHNAAFSNARPTVGTFLSSKDADGFVKIKVNL